MTVSQSRTQTWALLAFALIPLAVLVGWFVTRGDDPHASAEFLRWHTSATAFWPLAAGTMVMWGAGSLPYDTRGFVIRRVGMGLGALLVVLLGIWVMQSLATVAIGGADFVGADVLFEVAKPSAVVLISNVLVFFGFGLGVAALLLLATRGLGRLAGTVLTCVFAVVWVLPVYVVPVVLADGTLDVQRQAIVGAHVLVALAGMVALSSATRSVWVLALGPGLEVTASTVLPMAVLAQPESQWWEQYMLWLAGIALWALVLVISLVVASKRGVRGGDELSAVDTEHPTAGEPQVQTASFLSPVEQSSPVQDLPPAGDPVHTLPQPGAMEAYAGPQEHRDQYEPDASLTVDDAEQFEHVEPLDLPVAPGKRRRRRVDPGQM